MLYSIGTRISKGDGKFGSCAKASGDFACLTNAYNETLESLYRHPIDAAQVSALVKIAADNAELLGRQDAVARSIESALLSPDFIYLTNVGEEGKSNGLMTPYELASRMAFAIWASAPDAALIEAAKTGGLSKQVDIEAQAKRMLDDPKSSRGITRFILGWSGALSLASRNKAGDAAWTPEIANDALNETRAFVDNWWKSGAPSFANLLEADHTFASKKLAAYYGLPFPGGTGVQKIMLPANSGRGGLLTQTTFLAASTGSIGTSSTQRGHWVQERALCRAMVAPANTNPPDGPIERKDSDQARDYHERLITTGCSSACHKQLEPPGFLFEGYDGIGRKQSAEKGKPIRTDATVSSGTDIDGTYPNAAPFITALGKSDVVRGCVANFMLGHGFGREATDKDAALRDSVKEALKTDAKKAMLLLVSAPTFRAAVK